MPTSPPQHNAVRMGTKQRPSRIEDFCNRARWRRLRKMVLSQEPLCNDPYDEHMGFPIIATDVDHIVPRRDRPDLAYTRTNLQALCKSCHSRKTNEGR